MPSPWSAISTRKTRLTPDEIARPFDGELSQRFPPIVSPEQLAELLGKSRKTVYD
ncbi:hypothetical protein [Fimbriiglobus ruber]|uniref:Uncharacterized protein n=1 Tax=Fimbriiglobus ruber TaxID=1908690 RepID=A0A225DIG3_9BACT|nr:hypothetical protein [Fimbriiglobus ruber]OWK41241.1 hypothetical protein FRUB_04604 [Fimbriiglobus ruber]